MSFAMLPAYLSYFMGSGEPGTPDPGPADPATTGRASRHASNVARGLVTGAVVSAGFLVVFGVSGALVTAGFRSIIDYVPWVALVIGILLTVLGTAILLGFKLNVSLPQFTRAASGRGYRSMFLFGVSYAAASSSCALLVFLAVVGVAQTAPTFLAGVATFLFYGLGMSMLMVALTLALSVARDSVVGRMRVLLPHIGRMSGAILLLSGLYITVYWAPEQGRSCAQNPPVGRGFARRKYRAMRFAYPTGRCWCERQRPGSFPSRIHKGGGGTEEPP